MDTQKTNKTITLDSDGKKEFAIAFISNLPLDPVCSVKIYEDKETRRTVQNALYWRWLTVIAGELGGTKEDWHETFKGKFLVHIYERDDSDYAAMIESVRAVHRAGMKVEAEHLRKEIVRLTSTTTASVQQFAEYLKEIENFCNGKVYLPRRDDDYYRTIASNERI